MMRDTLSDQQELARSFSAALVRAPMGMPTTNEEGANGNPQEPLRRQSTTEMNRTRVAESQRIIAAQLMAYSLPVLGCLAILLLMVLVAGFVIYVQGWIVFSNTYKTPCDQPLQWWLLVMLFVPIVHLHFNNQRGQSTEDQVARKLQALAMPIGIVVGIWMYMRCKTCPTTNPELYYYAKRYLIYQIVIWVMMVFMSCGLVSLIFWAHRNGLLETGPGPHAAGRAGLINDVQTVTFEECNFSQNDDDELDPPECPICMQEYDEDSVIKRTPCGHIFHEQCLGKWLSDYGKICPLCRDNLEQAVENHSGTSGP